MLNNFYFFYWVSSAPAFILTSGAFDLSWKVKGRRKKKNIINQFVSLLSFVKTRKIYWHLMVGEHS